MKLILALISVMIVGCATYGPNNNQPLAKINQLGDLSGTYNNLGESDSPEYKTYLSSVIWGKDIDSPHNSIDKVKVVVLSEKNISVEAIAGDNVIKSSQFENGVDFEVLEDRIRIHKRLYISGSEPGNLFLGPIYETVDLGIDVAGNGKFRESEVAVGVIALVIPFAIGVESDVRFKKIGQE